jgi:hypothetical protein
MSLIRKFLPSLEPLLLAALVGSLWLIGYLAVPVLFATLPDKQLAGNVAGEMFRPAAYLQLVCAIALAALWVAQPVGRWQWRVLAFLATMTALSLWGIQPYMAELKRQALPAVVMESVLRGEFAMWHGISSILHLLESLLGAWLLLQRWRDGLR